MAWSTKIIKDSDHETLIVCSASGAESNTVAVTAGSLSGNLAAWLSGSLTRESAGWLTGWLAGSLVS